MPYYRKKPVIIEAVKWTGLNWKEIHSFMADKELSIYPNKELIIHTLEGDMKANAGDYIIKGVKGEFYPCKPDIFNQTYELVEDTKNAK